MNNQVNKNIEDFETKWNKTDEEKILNAIHSNTVRFMTEILHVKNRGKYSCTCPFHHSKDPDFSYDRKTGMWRCWGKCDAIYNNGITVVACLYNGIDLHQYNKLKKTEKHYLYTKAFLLLKNWIDNGDVGISLEDDVDENLKNALLRIKDSESLDEQEKMKSEYNYALATSNFQVKDYADKYYIKDHPEDLYPYLTVRGILYSKDKARLIKEGRFSKEAINEYEIYTYYDNKEMPRFIRNFYFYPIYDENGVLVASQGRKFKSIKDSSNFSIPKMYNPKGFSKNKVLFGLAQVLKRLGNEFVFKSYCNNELKLIHKPREIMIHEGPADTVKAFEHGYNNSVSLMGKTISDEQIALIKKVLSDDGRVIVFLDSDEPGKNASKNVCKALLDAGLNVYVGNMITGEKDVGESSKENFWESYKKVTKVQTK